MAEYLVFLLLVLLLDGVVNCETVGADVVVAVVFGEDCDAVGADVVVGSVFSGGGGCDAVGADDLVEALLGDVGEAPEEFDSIFRVSISKLS